MKRLFFLGIIIFSVLIIINLGRSIYDIWKKQDVFSQAQKTLEGEKKRNQTLTEDLKKVQDPQFIEREARNKLFMVKENEEELLIPQASLQASPSGTPKKIPVWRQWFLLLFGREGE